MPNKKPASIDASILVAAKGGVSSAGARTAAQLQRGQRATELLVDLNFKVPAEFRQRFKQLALDERLKNVQLLNRMIEVYEGQLADAFPTYSSMTEHTTRRR